MVEVKDILKMKKSMVYKYFWKNWEWFVKVDCKIYWEVKFNCEIISYWFIVYWEVLCMF